MRNPERITPFLDKFRAIWEKYPDLRFGQLISNIKISDEKGFLFNVEDDKFEEYMDSFEERHGQIIKRWEEWQKNIKLEGK